MLSLITLVVFVVSVGAENIHGVNLALNKPAFHSSTHLTLVANNAVNGQLAKNAGHESCAVTGEGNSPWWSVKLDEVFPVSKVEIYGIQDNAESLIGAVVSVLDLDLESTAEPMNSIIRRTVIGQITAENIQTIPITIAATKPAFGNLVNIQLVGKTGQLTLCEVEVYAEVPICDNVPDNIAVDKSTLQSSTSWNRYSSNDVNANLDTDIKQGKEFCTRTKQETTPWWSIDLGEMKRISKIQIFNREDCCAERLIGAIVRIIDVNLEKELTALAPKNLYEVGTVTEKNYQQSPIIFELPTPLSGNIVVVSLDGKDDVLTLCEVEIALDCRIEEDETNDVDVETSAVHPLVQFLNDLLVKPYEE